MSLNEKLHPLGQFVFLYGTTPPRLGASDERIAKAADRLAQRTRELPLDGIVVYDVQDESSRTAEPRPFPFLPTMDSRIYGKTLASLTGRDVLAYKCIGGMTEEQWQDWLTETKEQYGLSAITPVGMPTSAGNPSPMRLSQALRLAADSGHGFTVGGVAIAERHSDTWSESQRMVSKARNGCAFFISQAVYHAEPTIRLLKDYVRDCEAAGILPNRVVLTFAPCGRPETLAFMKWLGIAIPEETESRILSAAAPLTESIEICCANLRAILDNVDFQRIPLGLNIESVSIKKEEIDASIDLCHALRETLKEAM